MLFSASKLCCGSFISGVYYFYVGLIWCRYLSFKQVSDRMCLTLRDENVHLHCLHILCWDRLTSLTLGLPEKIPVLGMISLHKASQDLLAPGWSSEWYHSYITSCLALGSHSVLICLLASQPAVSLNCTDYQCLLSLSF